MSKPKRKLTSAEKRARRERKRKYMTVFMHGKQKRVLRPDLIEGLPVEEFIARNADPIWLHQNEMWELIEPEAGSRDRRPFEPIWREMRDRWLSLIARVSNDFDREAACDVFDELFACYTSADRGYHNIGHIAACLQMLDVVRAQARQRDCIELALWFHDAVYDSHASDNEEASARLAADSLFGLGVPQETTQVVCNLILATRHDAAPADPDAALMVDIDLSILGQSEEVFDEYEAGVRCEYDWASEPAFRAGRSRILRSFLDRPRIYVTDYFRDRLEACARWNLNRSLARLSVI